VSLTEHGAAYFERCRQVLAELEEAELVLKDSQLEPSGNLRIDMPVSFGRLKVVPLLGPFQAKYPHINLRATFTDRYIDLIEEGVDVCMRLGPLHDSSLIARRLSGAGFKVVGSPREAETDRGFDRPQLPGVYVSRNAPREGMAFHARRR
jgi:LysR family transcriptional regulator, regulator for bpeEF and oprC